MPKSRVRKKKVYTPPTELSSKPTAARQKPSPTWVPVLAVALIVFGIAWLVLFYLSKGQYPFENLRYWNLGIGFGCLVGSLLVLSRWR